MKFPVVDHPDALRFQKLCHPVADGEHIVTLVQGAVGGGFLIVRPVLLVAFGGVGVDDEYRRPALNQAPGQGAFHQRRAVRFLLGGGHQLHRLGIFGGEHRAHRLRGVVRGRGGLKGKGKRKGPNCPFGLFLDLPGGGPAEGAERPLGQPQLKHAEKHGQQYHGYSEFSGTAYLVQSNPSRGYSGRLHFGLVLSWTRSSRKNSCINSAHACSSTPPSTTGWWLKFMSNKLHTLRQAPYFSSLAP